MRSLVTENRKGSLLKRFNICRTDRSVTDVQVQAPPPVVESGSVQFSRVQSDKPELGLSSCACFSVSSVAHMEGYENLQCESVPAGGAVG